jgi:hypothetical protein
MLKGERSKESEEKGGIYCRLEAIGDRDHRSTWLKTHNFSFE